jgi:riboflavin synthase alpha subunit
MTKHLSSYLYWKKTDVLYVQLTINSSEKTLTQLSVAKDGVLLTAYKLDKNTFQVDNVFSQILFA